MNGVTAAIILDNRFKKRDGTYAIKLRITFNGHQEYYPLKKSLLKDDWEKLHAEKVKEKELRILKFTFTEIEKKLSRFVRIWSFSALQNLRTFSQVEPKRF